MKTLLKFSAASAILLLTACGEKTDDTDAVIKPPATEAKAVKALDAAQAKLATAKENYMTAQNHRAVFRTCSEENVLADISSYATRIRRCRTFTRRMARS